MYVNCIVEFNENPTEKFEKTRYIQIYILCIYYVILCIYIMCIYYVYIYIYVLKIFKYTLSMSQTNM